MNDSEKQVANARLVSVRADADQQRAILQFNRDVMLKSTRLPIQFCDSSAAMQDVPPQATWSKDAPGVISVELPWAIGTDDSFFIFIPEGMSGLVSASGGRVLSAVMWGIAT